MSIPKCQMGSWVKGVGVKPCRNSAKVIGYYSEQDFRLVCNRHAGVDFRYLGPLGVTPTSEPAGEPK